MKLKLRYLVFIVICLLSDSFYGQAISLYNQFNGRYDFLFIGNTLNTVENNNVANNPPPCTILTGSSATLNLGPSDLIQSAYLYWAGSGTGDFTVKLNGVDIVPTRTFPLIQASSQRPFFSAFADITAQVQATGNGVYNLTDLDLTSVIPLYCENGTNFGGWAIVCVFKNPALPLNQLNIYDGLEAVPSAINIVLNTLNVIDNIGAKIGFVAWEGDKNISVNESLRINNNLIGNPPLNPSDNAFNGTNSFTAASDIYNMDLDVYDIQNNINIGDTSATIQLTSGQDFVMINCIVTKLNSQLPDATVMFNNVSMSCNSKLIDVDYTVFNVNSTADLPAGTPVAIYAGSTLVGTLTTTLLIPVGGSETGHVTITLPPSVPNNFTLSFSADDNGTHTGVVTELNETNNIYSDTLNLLVSDLLIHLEPVVSCNLGLLQGIFDFSAYENTIKNNPTDVVAFYPTMADAENSTNAITNISNYSVATTPATIYVRVDNGVCFSIGLFQLLTKNCPPTAYNFVSANNDTINDGFFVDGLRDIFLNYRIYIYNRWGALVWTGDNSVPNFEGFANRGIRVDHSPLPTGTYYYVVDLNDPNYDYPLVGFLYLQK